MCAACTAPRLAPDDAVVAPLARRRPTSPPFRLSTLRFFGPKGLARSSGWNGSFERLTGLGNDGMLFAAEDGALWQRRRRAPAATVATAAAEGSFHFLVHRFAAANGSTVGSQVGGHAYSADGLSWAYSPHAAYNTSVRWASPARQPTGAGARGGPAVDTDADVLYRRERPKPLFDRRSGEMVALFNGAWPCHIGAEDDDTRDSAAGCESFTIVTGLR